MFTIGLSAGSAFFIIISVKNSRICLDVDGLIHEYVHDTGVLREKPSIYIKPMFCKVYERSKNKSKYEGIRYKEKKI